MNTLRTLLLVFGVYSVAYVVNKPGDQYLLSFTAGVLLFLYVATGGIKR